MKDIDFNQRLGRFLAAPVAGEPGRAFVPPLLPPVPAILTDRLLTILSERTDQRPPTT